MPTGNQNISIVADPPLTGIGDLVGHATALLRGGPYPWVILGVLVVAIAARRVLPDATLLLIVAVATGVVVAGFVLNLPFGAQIAFLRYVAPLPEGLAVFCVCEVMRGCDAAGLPQRRSGDRCAPVSWLSPRR